MTLGQSMSECSMQDSAAVEVMDGACPAPSSKNEARSDCGAGDAIGPRSDDEQDEAEALTVSVASLASGAHGVPDDQEPPNSGAQSQFQPVLQPAGDTTAPDGSAPPVQLETLLPDEFTEATVDEIDAAARRQDDQRESSIRAKMQQFANGEEALNRNEEHVKARKVFRQQRQYLSVFLLGEFSQDSTDTEVGAEVTGGFPDVPGNAHPRPFNKSAGPKNAHPCSATMERRRIRQESDHMDKHRARLKEAELRQDIQGSSSQAAVLGTLVAQQAKLGTTTPAVCQQVEAWLDEIQEKLARCRRALDPSSEIQEVYSDTQRTKHSLYNGAIEALATATSLKQSSVSPPRSAHKAIPSPTRDRLQRAIDKVYHWQHDGAHRGKATTTDPICGSPASALRVAKESGPPGNFMQGAPAGGCAPSTPAPPHAELQQVQLAQLQNQQQAQLHQLLSQQHVLFNHAGLLHHQLYGHSTSFQHHHEPPALLTPQQHRPWPVQLHSHYPLAAVHTCPPTYMHINQTAIPHEHHQTAPHSLTDSTATQQCSRHASTDQDRQPLYLQKRESGAQAHFIMHPDSAAHPKDGDQCVALSDLPAGLASLSEPQQTPPTQAASPISETSDADKHQAYPAPGPTGAASEAGPAAASSTAESLPQSNNFATDTDSLVCSVTGSMSVPETMNCRPCSPSPGAIFGEGAHDDLDPRPHQ
eukprot:gene3974-728_t